MQTPSQPMQFDPPSRLDGFLISPFVIAAVLWQFTAGPTAINTVGLFPPLSVLVGIILIPAAALWALFLLARTLVDRTWRKAASILAAAITFTTATWACFEYRTDILVTTAVWRIKVQMIGMNAHEAAQFRSNRGISDGDGDPFMVVVHEPSGIDAPEPGQREKIWKSYDVTITGTIKGCKIVSRPLDGDFYLRTICVKEE